MDYSTEFRYHPRKQQDRYNYWKHVQSVVRNESVILVGQGHIRISNISIVERGPVIKVLVEQDTDCVDSRTGGQFGRPKR